MNDVGTDFGAAWDRTFDEQQLNRQAFDNRHLRLPGDEATITVSPLESMTPIPYVTDLNPIIARKAPWWNATYSPATVNGSIRRLEDIDRNYSDIDGIGSLGAGQCSDDFEYLAWDGSDQEFPNGTTIEIVETNRYVAGRLDAELNGSALQICNIGKQTIAADALNDIYVQIFHPGVKIPKAR